MKYKKKMWKRKKKVLTQLKIRVQRTEKLSEKGRRPIVVSKTGGWARSKLDGFFFFLWTGYYRVLMVFVYIDIFIYVYTTIYGNLIHD